MPKPEPSPIGDQLDSLQSDDTNSGSSSGADGMRIPLKHGSLLYLDESSPSLDVIPLQISGSVDCDLSNVAANELMKWGLANLWKDGHEGGYAIWHGHQPVSDFPP